MGICYSSNQSDPTAGYDNSYANLVSLTGQIRQYPIPATVSQVLSYEACSPDLFIVCNSDALNFNDFIPSMALNDQLEPAQLYFVLPVSKLKYRLAASDMAAMAVKASVALNAVDSKHRRSSRARISPVLVKDVDQSSDHPNHISVNIAKASKVESTVGISRSVSRRKSARYGSRRSKVARLSFKMKLSTINEGSMLVN